MIRLDETGRAIRDYFFANHEGDYNDIETIKIIIDSIDSSKQDWMNELLKDSPDTDIIDECMEDIEFQKENMKPFLNELSEYCSMFGVEIDVEEILEEICKEDINCGIYRIIEDWEDIAAFSENIWDRLDDSYGKGLSYLRDDMCKEMMNYLEHNNNVRKQIVSKSR